MYTNRWLDLLALIAGACLTLSFAPFHYWPLAIIAISALIHLIEVPHCSTRLWRGFLFGLSHFSTGVYWVFISMNRFGHMGVISSGALTALFVSVLALFTAFTCYFYGYKLSQVAGTFLRRVLVFPALWLLFEVIRTGFLTGFPWLALGYSQLNSPLTGFIPLLGVFGTGFFVTCTAGLLVNIVKPGTPPFRFLSVIFLAIIAFVGVKLTHHSWTTPAGKPIKVALVQANVPQTLKWDPERLRHIMATYHRLAEQTWSADIAVWPEASLPATQNFVKPFLARVNQKALATDTSLLLGIPFEHEKHFYNSLITLGNGRGQYFKRHLVPFGEYLPDINLITLFVEKLKIPMSHFSAGYTKQTLPMAAGHPFAPFICFEIAFPRLMLDMLPQAQYLVTISDDSWFGESSAATQHLDIARMRSLESGRYQILSTNSGPSAIIDPQGHVLKASKMNQQTVLKGQILPMKGKTPWVRIWKD